MTDILDDLQWRGLLQDSTDLDELRKHLAEGPVTFYVGFDPTAPSLQVGNLVQVLTARRLQQAGNIPVLLVGGATGLIGDPKAEGERSLNSEETVAGWVDKIRRQVEPFFEFEGANAARMVNNLDWTSPLSAIEFLRDVGKHFPVNQMLAREVVKARLESGISFTEFAYQILQSHDFYQLHERYGVTLQHGGSDQWGNIIAGVDFNRRKGVRGVHAFTTPLITRADGTKFGKSAEGMSVWMDAAMTSPYAFYQFWFNAADADIVNYLKVFSFRSRAEIEELARETAERPFARAAQRALAEELTTLLHGKDECEQVITASQALFGRGALTDLAPSTLRSALAEAGLVEVDELPSVAVLFKESGLAASLGEARRAVAEGGAYVNNERMTDADAPVSADLLLHGKYLVLRRGKKTIAGAELRK
ncbi:tyrosine--tRNA ligase [Catellatospora citrea]|uniref:Tyrosine--tRNA ligase n=1 Tax=Catellatospora citrea TaxID=53366 RepID=A0A8J3KJA8_9ACTN|nr:tyrosine--tRNA ligase [Catellatospora citrea]RKE11841.1 tyrosyl-tRNA synthetase [Catellatospora citrea]GIF99893.1 tyrosine--tRNA ligase [Catellatospora citrea]